MVNIRTGLRLDVAAALLARTQRKDRGETGGEMSDDATDEHTRRIAVDVLQRAIEIAEAQGETTALWLVQANAQELEASKVQDHQQTSIERLRALRADVEAHARELEGALARARALRQGLGRAPRATTIRELTVASYELSERTASLAREQAAFERQRLVRAPLRAAEAAERTKDASFAHFMLQVLQSPVLLKRGAVFIIAVATALAALVTLTVCVVTALSPTATVTMEKNGTLVFSTTKNRRLGQVLVSANGGSEGPWVDTGLTVCEGQQLTIRASGKVNLAFHRTVEAAFFDIAPPHPWVGPAGLPSVEDARSFGFPYDPRADDTRRRAFLPVEAPYGALIAATSVKNPLRILPKRGTSETKSHELGPAFLVGERYEGALKTSGKLWLAVNEIWLSTELKPAYAATPTKALPPHPQIQLTDPRDGGFSYEDGWKDIEGRGYWGVWYDDNAGAFLATIEIDRKNIDCPAERD